LLGAFVVGNVVISALSLETPPGATSNEIGDVILVLSGTAVKVYRQLALSSSIIWSPRGNGNRDGMSPG
jgi:hypothetical protein